MMNAGHAGHAEAYNAGIANMTGEWLTSLDSDDMMHLTQEPPVLTMCRNVDRILGSFTYGTHDNGPRELRPRSSERYPPIRFCVV